MKPYCEVFVLKMLPALRSELAKDLTERYGMNQSLAAKKLGISQACISQYLRELRGRSVLKDKDVCKAVADLSKKISKKSLSHVQIMSEFCNICMIMQKKKLLCKQHMKMYRKLEDCNLCVEAG